MECHVCGKYYSLTHNCVAPARPSLDDVEVDATPSPSQREFAPVPTEFAPLYYLRLAISIIRWDEVSVRRAARDPKALLYGMYSFSLGAFVLFSLLFMPASFAAVRESGMTGTWPALFSYIAGNLIAVVAVIAVGAFSVAQLGLCHLIAKWFCGAKGTFVGILRPLSLAWPISLVSIIPIGGSILATIAWAAVLMVVFEEVNQIRRLQAFVISYAVNLGFLAITSALL